MKLNRDTKKDTKRVNVKISPSAHRKAKSLAEAAEQSLWSYFDAMVEFFHRTGYDPKSFSSAGQSKVLGGIKRQLDFLVRMQKTHENAFIKPMAEAMLSLESGFAKLDRLHEHPGNVNTTISKFPNIEALSCPSCEKKWQELTIEEEEIHCPSCDFFLPLSVGNLVFSTLDIYSLLYGGITKVYRGFEHEGGKEGPLRFKLHESGRIMMVKEGR
ncbi:MAG: BfmA/BtgA family mobilization protein [Bacteroidota bacterium]